ncbi:MAG: hypothetical protein IPL79_12355 [Myxococcales bacterium]|nr:hypothetical protein [Myxococcales bacterium]
MSKSRDPRVGRTQTVLGAVPQAAAVAAAAEEAAAAHDDAFSAFNNVPTMELGSHAGVGQTLMAGSGPITERTMLAAEAAGGKPTASIEVIPTIINVVAYQPQLELATAVDSKRASAYRVTRHQILAQKPGTVMLVTSAEPGEGKSMTALNLALAFSELSPGRTLLVEANFRRPSLVNALDLTKYRCFRAQMVAQRSHPAMPLGVVHIAPTALHVLPVRPWGPGENVTPFLDAIAMTRAIYALRSSGYERIIVDAASTLEAADVNLLQDACDGIITVVRTRHTSAGRLREVVERLSPARFLGTILV